jgi:hypothetical protein
MRSPLVVSATLSDGDARLWLKKAKNQHITRHPVRLHHPRPHRHLHRKSYLRWVIVEFLQMLPAPVIKQV